MTPAQVILAWSQIGGHAVIPKSVTPSRIRENFQEVELDADAVAALNKLGETPLRFNIPLSCKSILYTAIRISRRLMDCADKPKWDINVFSDEKENAATHQVIQK